MRSVICLTSGLPIESTSNESLSIDASPIVNPDIRPAKQVQNSTTLMFTQKFPSIGSAASGLAASIFEMIASTFLSLV
jgi:hypothetical protein